MIDFKELLKLESVYDLVDIITCENLKDAWINAYAEDGKWLMDDDDYWALLGAIKYFSTHYGFEKFCEEQGITYE